MPNPYHDKKGRFSSRTEAANARKLKAMGFDQATQDLGAVPDMRTALRQAFSNPMTAGAGTVDYERDHFTEGERGDLGVTVPVKGRITGRETKVKVFDFYGPLPRALEQKRNREMAEGRQPGLLVVDEKGNLYEQVPRPTPKGMTGTPYETVALGGRAKITKVRKAPPTYVPKRVHGY
jgi:hypothetical protein